MACVVKGLTTYMCIASSGQSNINKKDEFFAGQIQIKKQNLS
jgi:hypothetical protein